MTCCTVTILLHTSYKDYRYHYHSTEELEVGDRVVIQLVSNQSPTIVEVVEVHRRTSRLATKYCCKVNNKDDRLEVKQAFNKVKVLNYMFGRDSPSEIIDNSISSWVNRWDSFVGQFDEQKSSS